MNLTTLKQQGRIWHLDQPRNLAETQSSGFSELDLLLGGGWPAREVLELFTPVGIGELRLLLPWLKRAQAQSRLLVFINAPAIPCAQMWQSQGFALSQMLILTASKLPDALWVAEQCLKSGCCSTVLLWQNKLTIGQVKRLQLCAAEGQASLVLLRAAQTQAVSLPVALSLALSADPAGIRAKVLKRRGGWPGQQQLIPMQSHWPRLVQQSSSPQPGALVLSSSA